MMTAFFVFMTVLDLSAAAIVFAGALSEKMRLYPTWHKIGLIVASIGLVSQGLRNIQFIATGVSPTDSDLPLWALKDTGIAIIAYFYLAIAVSAVVNKKKAPVKSKRSAK
jgi:hypothetical protein